MTIILYAVLLDNFNLRTKPTCLVVVVLWLVNLFISIVWLYKGLFTFVSVFPRLVEFTRKDGTAGRRVRPYIIDLASGNGTYLNNQRIESQRYYELKEKDVLKFGFSSREYVLLHEFSDTSEVDAKQQEEEEDDEGLDE